MGRCVRIFGLWALSMGMLGALAALIIGASQTRIGAVEAETLAAQAREQAAEGRWEEALDSYAAALRYQPSRLAWQLKYGEMAFRNGAWPRALDAAAQAMAHAADPASQRDAAVLWARLMLAQGQASQVRDTIAALPQAVARLPELQALAAEACKQMGAFPAMAEALRQVAEGDVDACSAAYRAGRRDLEARIRLAREEMARPSATQADAYGLAVLLIEGGQWEAAAALLRVAVESDGAPGDAFFWLGAYAESTGKREAALAHYREALVHTPNHRRAALRKSALELNTP